MAFFSRTRSGFNPRPPCGGRPILEPRCHWLRDVSIHAPRAEGDSPVRAFQLLFQSTPPVPCGSRTVSHVSIHAPRAEGDHRGRHVESTPPVPGRQERYRRTEGTCFNPRPPCGGRLRAVQPPARQELRAGPPRTDGLCEPRPNSVVVCILQSTPNKPLGSCANIRRCSCLLEVRERHETRVEPPESLDEPFM